MRAHRRTIFRVTGTASASLRVVIEVAVDSATGGETAARAGADRLELCQDLGAGGLTPSLGLFETLRAAVAVPVFVLVRPRPGDFLYDRAEFAAMLRDIGHLRAAGAAGIVTGALLANGHVDRERLRELLAAAAPMPVTFHRAFDVAAEPLAALATLHELGVARVLTSGQAKDAVTGTATIAALVRAAPAGLSVMAGAGVRDTNVRELVAATGVREVHLSATQWLPSGMTFRRPGVPMGAATVVDEFAVRATDGGHVARVVAVLRP